MSSWDYITKEKEIVVIDLETTGFSPSKGARIIEIGAVKIKNKKIIKEFSTLINPEIKIPDKITNITGITNDMVKDSKPIGQVMLELRDFIDGCIIVAHNAKFDWDRFLVYFFKKIGVTFSNPIVFDTQVLAKETFKDLKKYNLANLCEYLGIQIQNHHRAIDDARVTAEIFLKFMEIYIGELPVAENFEPEQVIKEKQDKINIRTVRYWEKKNSKRILYQRIYVNLFVNNVFGTIFFDIPSRSWYVKECEENIDLMQAQEAVLAFLKLSSVNALCQYRNVS